MTPRYRDLGRRISRLQRAPAGLALAVGLGSGCSGRDATLVLADVPSPDVQTLPASPGVEPPASSEATATPSSSSEPVYVTGTVVLSSEGDNTYVSLLSSLDTQALDLRRAREFPGWSGIWAHDGKLFVSDGESPTMTRYGLDAQGGLRDEGRLSFLNEGAAFADSVFVGQGKAYVFAERGVVWDARALEITGGFEIPLVADRPGAMQYSGLRTGRALAVRGNRAFVATNWANWDEYAVSEDSLIVVIDTDTDTVIDALAAPCPYLDVASLDDDGNVYFSNWVYSLGPTLLEGKKQACAVRIRAGEERLDDSWSLTFADVTDGREAAALRYVGGHQAIISVFHDEQAEMGPDTDPATLANAANWRFWLLNLDTLTAAPVDDVAPHAGGFTASRVGDRTFLLVPSADYESTSVYELSLDGSATLRWSVRGWSTELFELR